MRTFRMDEETEVTMISEMPDDHPLLHWRKQKDPDNDSETKRRIVYFESHSSENGRTGHFIFQYHKLSGGGGKTDEK